MGRGQTRPRRCINMSCGRMFEGKRWMTLCPDCYQTERLKDDRVQFYIDQAGGELPRRECDHCHESYQPRYQLDVICSDCLLEGFKLCAEKSGVSFQAQVSIQRRSRDGMVQ